jgi:orotate phosphoribosyltransferase
MRNRSIVKLQPGLFLQPFVVSQLVGTVIEDVVTTGGDSLRSAQVLRDAGANVIHLIVVLDRGEGGEDNIRNAGIPYTPLFRIQDLELD